MDRTLVLIWAVPAQSSGSLYVPVYTAMWTFVSSIETKTGSAFNMALKDWVNY
jgi:hypothetical protein